MKSCDFDSYLSVEFYYWLDIFRRIFL